MLNAKRGYTKEEAMQYLGLKRRTFETHILPLIKAQGVKVGTSTIYEVTDIDAAWEQFKTSAKGTKRWQARDTPASLDKMTAVTMWTNGIAEIGLGKRASRT